tara:strand:- start:1825 stop:2010 length:186 start_codon:yes stop_codon:yes gene_type:complete
MERSWGSSKRRAFGSSLALGNLAGLKWGRMKNEKQKKWKNKTDRFGSYKNRNEARKKVVRS